MACPGFDSGSFVGGMLGYVDCQAQTIGASAFATLAAPGSSLSLVLTGLLTLFVAIFGYRLLMGHDLGVRDGVLALVKIGIVLVMTSSWPAYRTLVYDVALRAPAELVAEIGVPAELPGAAGGMVARLDFADQALAALAIAGAGQVPPPQPGAPAIGQPVPPPFGGFDAFAFGGSRILFLAAVIGAFAAVRIVAGILLAVAPFFFAFLLFDATRGLFEGWLRVLAGAALGAFGTGIVLGIELALIEPWLLALLDARAAGQPIPNAPVELFVVTLVFCLALAAVIFAVARMAMGFRLAPALRALAPALAPAGRLSAEPLRVPHLGDTSTPAEGRSRATAVADAVAASQRRETQIAAMGGPSRQTVTLHQRAGHPSQAAGPAVVVTGGAAGQGASRRTATRVSASANRRDQPK